MIIYTQNGMRSDEGYLTGRDDKFYIQYYPDNPIDPYMYPGDGIKYDLDADLVELYDSLRDFFFEDTKSFYIWQSLYPFFAMEGGQSSDCPISAEDFAKLIYREPYSGYPDFYRYLYLIDCQYLVGTVQNLLEGMEHCFISYFVLLSDIGRAVPTGVLSEDYDGVQMEMSPISMTIAALLESYFTKAYSILDILCKIAYEFENPPSGFEKYMKLKSAEKLWGSRKNLGINHTENTIFEDCDLIRTIESIRNEIVHNGAWELRPRVFMRYQNGALKERFMLFPDIKDGHLTVVKNRKHFFSYETRVNDILPEIHSEFKERLLNTVKVMIQRYQR